MERRYNLKALQVGVHDRHLVISNTDEVVDGEPAMLMSVDLSSPRELTDFLRLFTPVLVAAGIDLTTLIPGGASD